MKKGRRIGGYVVTSCVSIVLTLAVVCFVFKIDVTRLPSQVSLLSKMAQVDMYVGHKYVDDYDFEKAADNAASGYLSTLEDDYAEYFSVENEAENKKDTAGGRFGIGVNIAADPTSGEITVIYVNRQSPAAKAGLKKYDVVTEYNGISAKGKTTDDFVKEISGEEGKDVSLKILRGGKTIDIRLKCADYTADSVNWRTYENLGIINITTFDDTTKEQFDDAVKLLKSEKVKGFIIDLRNNLGGSVDACTAVLDELLGECDTCRVRYNDGKISVIGHSDKNMDDTPLCVLVNGYSASASEIFACAIRDNERGKIVGTKTFGKGIMQTTYELSDSSAVKFTTAYVVDKSGETYHKKGLEPDVEAELSEDESKRFYFLDDKSDSQINECVKLFS